MRRILLIVFCLSCFKISFSQQDVREIIDEIIETSADGEEEESENETQINAEELEYLISNPINLNNCTFSDLQTIPFLTDYQINEILDYRMEYGRFYTLGELKGLNISTKELKILRHLVFAGEPLEQKSKIKLSYGHHTVMTTIKTVFEEPKGYKTGASGKTPFEGGRQAYLIKYRYKLSDKVSWGLTAEKDMGEKISFGEKKYGFDFNSAFVKIANFGHLEKLIIGDFSVKFGEGLLFSQGFMTGKFIAGSNFGSTQSILKEYTSANENSFYRGAAATTGIKHLKITALISRNKLDASSDETTFQTLKNDGYHRTESEISKKNSVTRTIAGMILCYCYKKTNLSAACQYYNYDKTYIPDDKLCYANTRNEKEGTAFSFSYSYTDKKQNLKTELAFDRDLNHAFIGTWTLRPTNFLNFSFLYRNYSKKYLSLTARAFGENTKVSNEEGCYFGTYFQPLRFLLIETWLDVFRFPWLTTYVKMPSSGYDFLCQTTWYLSKKCNILMRYKQKRKQTAEAENAFKKNEYFRTITKYSLSENTVLSSAVQWSFYNAQNVKENGYMIYQNVQHSFKKVPLSFAVRYALFSAPYNARIYAYENDVSYSFSFPAYYYKGSRYYITAGYSFFKRFTIQMRFSRTKYFDRETIGSGNGFIDDNKKNELHLFFKAKL